jgi:hypothetical protein
MKNLVLNRNIPISFEQLGNIDERFARVKITLMHTGENLNGSIFSKDVVEAALPSLSNNPILAYIEDNKDDEIDFSNHRFGIVIESGDIKFKYKGSAYGVIPEDHNARWETIIGSDGTEREYLVCDGLVWTKFDDPIDILNRDGKKWQSMEIANNYSGHFDDNDKFVFESFAFNGACILGTYVQPAMVDANVELQFSSNTASAAFAEIKSKIEEYNTLIRDQNFSIEGGQNVNKKKEILAKYGISEENLAEFSIDIESISDEDFEGVLFEKGVIKNDETSATTTDNPVDDPAPAATDFAALTARQEISALSQKIADEGGSEVKDMDGWQWTQYNYYYLDHTGDTVVCESRADNWSLVGFGYTMDGDIPVIDWNTKTLLKVVYTPIDTGSGAGDGTTFGISKLMADIEFAKHEAKKEYTTKISEYESKISEMDSMTTELDSLREFQKDKLSEERTIKLDELFSRFSLTEDETSEVKKVAYETEESVENIETMLYALIGKKVASTYAKTPSTKGPLVRFNVEDPIVPKIPNKPYLDVLEKHSSKK